MKKLSESTLNAKVKSNSRQIMQRREPPAFRPGSEFSFDYAFLSYGDLGSTHKVGVLLAFGVNPRKSKKSENSETQKSAENYVEETVKVPVTFTPAVQQNEVIDGDLQKKSVAVVKEPGAEVKPLTNERILSLVKSGTSDRTIISLISQFSGEFDTRPEALIELRNAGVSNAVINAAINVTVSRTHPKTFPAML